MGFFFWGAFVQGEASLKSLKSLKSVTRADLGRQKLEELHALD
jgi:hypothetical protein